MGTGAHPCGAARSRRARRSLGTAGGRRSARRHFDPCPPWRPPPSASSRSDARPSAGEPLAAAEREGRRLRQRQRRLRFTGPAGRTRHAGDRRGRRGRASPRLAGSPGRLLAPGASPGGTTATRARAPALASEPARAAAPPPPGRPQDGSVAGQARGDAPQFAGPDAAAPGQRRTEKTRGAPPSAPAPGNGRQHPSAFKRRLRHRPPPRPLAGPGGVHRARTAG